MTAYYFKGIPDYGMSGFCAVRDAFDNLKNVLQLAELINMCGHCMHDKPVEDFDFVVFSGNYTRALVRKADGYFSMSIPFHVVFDGSRIGFNFDLIDEEVGGILISILRNALETAKGSGFAHDEMVISIADAFGLAVDESTLYADAFVDLLADDHGYFRFDDDPASENGDFHPRYHFDFFYKNSSSIKIGSDEIVDIECFYALFDGEHPKRYLRKAN